MDLILCLVIAFNSFAIGFALCNLLYVYNSRP